MNPVIKEDIKYITDTFGSWEFFKNKTVLITGAGGFLPSYLVDTLLNISDSYNIIVIGIVRNEQKAKLRFEHWRNNPRLKIVKHDVANKVNISEKINIIIHAASQASPKFYGTDPVGTINANLLGTINMLELAIINNVDSFLYFSSGEVYGQINPELMPIKENTFGNIDPIEVRSCYAESKRMGENLCVSYASQFNVKCKIVRPFHTYGPGLMLDDGRVFADFVAAIVNRENIVLKSSGKALRSFCYITDATIAFFRVLVDGEVGHAYNVGNPKEEYSILKLANKLVESNSDLGIQLIMTPQADSKEYLASPVLRNTPNIDKLLRLGWMPNISVDEGFKRTIDSFK